MLNFKETITKLARRSGLGLAGVMLVLAAPLAVAQTKAAASSSDSENMQYKGLAEVNLFGGGSFFQQVYQGLGTKHTNGGVVGASVTANFWRYVGIEFGFRTGTNNMQFLTGNPIGAPKFSYGSRLMMFNLNPVFNFTPRGSKYRPYVTVGVSSMDFSPTDTAIANANSPAQAGFGAQRLKGNVLAGINYGGGLKINLADWVGLQFDVRGLTSKNPTNGLPNFSSTGVYIPNKNSQSGIQTTAGINFYFGQITAPPPPPPPPAPKPQALPNLIPGSIGGYEGQLCLGRPISMRVTGSSDPAGKAATYRWKVDGQAAGTGQTISYTPRTAGPHTVEVEIEAPNNEGYPARMAKAGPVTFNVMDSEAPRVRVSANPTVVNHGDPSAITVQSTAGACTTSVTNSVRASEGRISGSGNNWTLDTSTVKFDETSGKPQSKTVTITATATSDAGKSATATTTVTVNYKPKALRYGDIIFSKGSARVNNCGKRILLEELAPKAADDAFDVVLVGHIDADEAPKGKPPARVKPLDYRRAMQAAAVLTAGSGTCAKLDPAKVKIAAVGTEQISDPQPGLCGTSARAATKERSGAIPTAADQNRRVEVWLVPKGSAMPASAKGATEPAAKELKAIGCPK
jgi:hypothetical protein